MAALLRKSIYDLDVICLQGGEIITNSSEQLESGESDNQVTGNWTHNRYVKGQNFQHRC